MLSGRMIECGGEVRAGAELSIVGKDDGREGGGMEFTQSACVRACVRACILVLYPYALFLFVRCIRYLFRVVAIAMSNIILTVISEAVPSKARRWPFCGQWRRPFCGRWR